MSKKALVVVSFGSTFDETRIKDIGGIETALANAFPAYDQYRAFTSKIIRKRLADRGILIDDLETTLDKLAVAGYEEVLLQPTHLINGVEFTEKIAATRDKYLPLFKKISVSRPLISEDEDYRLLTQAMLEQLPKLPQEDGIVLMGHGTAHNLTAHHSTYVRLQEQFDRLHAPVIIGTVEDDDLPNFASVLTQLDKRGYRHVHLYPLMVVAGDHANNDMYGDAPESWKSQIEARGITTTGHLNGIGRYHTIQSLYVTHALQALNNNN